MPDLDPRLMQCMEVWGGNEPVDAGVVMSGLDAWVYSKPFGAATAGGGDVYYVSSCATGRITRLLVADVSGHGPDVCDVAAQLRTLMRRYVNHLDQKHFVQSMNGRFTAMSASGCFATAVVTTFFAPAGALSVCNAGHPPPLLYRAATREWSFLEAGGSAGDDGECGESAGGDSGSGAGGGSGGDRGRENGGGGGGGGGGGNGNDRHGDGGRGPANIPLGILDLCDYEQFDVRLDVGDLVLCYTDSLPEARDAATADLLGQRRLLEVVRSIDPSGPPTFIPRLLAAIAARTGAAVDGDDVTILLFRANGLGAATPLAHRLLAPFRFLRAAAQDLRAGRGLPLPDLSLANLGGAVFAPLARRWKRARGGRPE